MDSNLTEQILNLRDGDHLCLFYDSDPAEQMPALIPFIREALSKNERFIYIADDQTVEDLAGHLRRGEIDVEKETAGGRLKLWTRKEWRQPGRLSSEKKAEQVRGLVKEAAEAGFKGIRFAVEMTWALGPDITAERLEHWEATINTLFIPDFPIWVICQYNRTRLSPEVLLAALRTHPKAVFGAEVCPNHFYNAPSPPDGNEKENSNGPSSSGSNGVNWMVSELKRTRAAMAEDIAERKRNAEISSRFAAIVDHSDDAIISKNLSGIIQSWNRSAERIFGYTAKEAIGKSVTILIPQERHDEEPEILKRIFRGERVEHYETIRQRKDGTFINVSLTVSPIKNELGEIVGASKIARDITERMRFERQRLALYELVATINRAPTLPEICNAAVEAIRQSQGADRAAILLYDNDNVMRFKAWSGLSDDYRRAVEGHVPWKPDDTDPQPVCIDDVATVPLDKDLRRVIEREGIRSLAFIPLTHQKQLLGKFMIYYNAPHHFAPDEIRPGQTIGSQVVFAIERQKSGEALEQLISERTKSLREAVAQMEEFSYTVSHDLRAPLRRMQFYSESLLQNFAASLPEEAAFSLERIAANAKRLDKMVMDVLTFSRLARGDFRLENVAVEKLVRLIVEQYPGMQAPQAEIQIESLPDVLGHEASMTQAFSNLLTNAVKFVPPTVKPKVRIWSERNNGHVRFWIGDNGIGVDPRYQHRLFNLFERIDPTMNYEGTGVGLAIVRKAVERMGGKVGMESDGKNGSKFWIEMRAGEQNIARE